MKLNASDLGNIVNRVKILLHRQTIKDVLERYVIVWPKQDLPIDNEGSVVLFVVRLLARQLDVVPLDGDII